MWWTIKKPHWNKKCEPFLTLKHMRIYKNCIGIILFPIIKKILHKRENENGKRLQIVARKSVHYNKLATGKWGD